MWERVRRTGWWVAAAVILGVLAFGAKEAIATPVYLVCEETNGGACPGGLPECEANCDAIYGPGNWAAAVCHGGDQCCDCFF